MKFRRSFIKALSAAGAVFLTLVLGLFAALSLMDSPQYAWRLLKYQEPDLGDWRIFPTRLILAPQTSSSLPSGPAWNPERVEFSYRGEQRNERLADLLDRTATSAFLIVQNDSVIFENQAPNHTRESIDTSFSMAKSIVSPLMGLAQAEGLISSIADPVVKYVPEIAGRGFDSLTIRDLLMMNTGIRYVHHDEQPFYMSPFGDDARSYYSPNLRRVALSVVASTTQVGTNFSCNNYHLLLEGLILERTMGMSMANFLEQRIWQPMGAEFDASWSLDSDSSGFEKMESGLNARAVDFARFGLIFLHHGRWNGSQIVPSDG